MEYKETQLKDNLNNPLMPITTEEQVIMGDGKTLREKFINLTVSNSISLGRKKDTEIGQGSVAEGVDTTASAVCSHAEGSGTTASGLCSHAEGMSTFALGSEAHTEGYGTRATDSYAHAEGFASQATAGCAHAEGQSTKALGSNSHSEGYITTAESPNSHAEGSQSHAEGYESHAEGYSTTAQGHASHAEGQQTLAKGDHSHAEGNQTRATSGEAHAEGFNTEASGQDSHAEGSGSTASGSSSHAEGQTTKASGSYSHSEGYYTEAVGLMQHVQGRFNITSESALHIVGNGLGTGHESNAHVLEPDGTAWFSGDVYVGSTSGKNKDEGSKKLVTSDEVEELIEPKQDKLIIGEGLTLDEETNTLSVIKAIFSSEGQKYTLSLPGDKKVDCYLSQNNGDITQMHSHVWTNVEKPSRINVSTNEACFFVPFIDAESHKDILWVSTQKDMFKNKTANNAVLDYLTVDTSNGEHLYLYKTNTREDIDNTSTITVSPDETYTSPLSGNILDFTEGKFSKEELTLIYDTIYTILVSKGSVPNYATQEWVKDENDKVENKLLNGFMPEENFERKYKVVRGTGLLAVDNIYSASPFIEVSPNTTYSIYCGGVPAGHVSYPVIAYYDINKEYIGCSYCGDPRTYTTDANTHFIRFTMKDITQGKIVDNSGNIIYKAQIASYVKGIQDLNKMVSNVNRFNAYNWAANSHFDEDTARKIRVLSEDTIDIANTADEAVRFGIGAPSKISESFNYTMVLNENTDALIDFKATDENGSPINTVKMGYGIASDYNWDTCSTTDITPSSVSISLSDKNLMGISFLIPANTTCVVTLKINN